MAGIEVVGLGRKLRLLVDYGHFDSLAKIAQEFNRSASTLQWWSHGDEGRARDTIPSKQFETLVEVVQKCLPEVSSRANAELLVLAPADELEAALHGLAQISFNAIIEAASPTDVGRLILKPKMDLIETDQNTSRLKPELSIALDSWFRLEFSSKMAGGYVSAFQHVGQTWGAVPSYLDTKKKAVLLPGLTDDGVIAYMRERKDAYTHRFVVMQTPEQAPLEFARYLSDAILLDGMILSRMAKFYEA